MVLHSDRILELMLGPDFQKLIGLGVLSGPQDILRFPGGSNVQSASVEKKRCARKMKKKMPPKV